VWYESHRIDALNLAGYRYRATAANVILRTGTPGKILGFTELPTGWHYGNGGPISVDVVQIALDLNAYLVSSGLINTDAFPGANGEIQLTAYHTTADGRQHFIGIMIEPTRELSLVYEINGQDGRAPVEAADVEKIKAIILEIARGIGTAAGEQWSILGTFTPKTSITNEDVLLRSLSKNQAWTAARPLFSEHAWMPSGMAIANMLERTIAR